MSFTAIMNDFVMTIVNMSNSDTPKQFAQELQAFYYGDSRLGFCLFYAFVVKFCKQCKK